MKGARAATFALIAANLILGIVLIARIRRSRRLRDELEQQRHDAQARNSQARGVALEYQRALFDYNQLVRHRMVNPLTAITAGLETLFRLDLDALDGRTRDDIITAMREQADELQHVIVDPSRLSAEEHEVGLRPLPEHGSERMFKLQAVKTEQAFRTLNQRRVVKAEPASIRDMIDFVCECAAPNCATRVRVSLGDYFRVREHEDRFIVAPGHNLPVVESVVESHRDWLAVEKLTEAEAEAEGAAAR